MLGQKISTGNKDFDDWLNGGYEPEVITCFYGPFASGKSNFCLMATANQLKEGKKVIYVDTEASLSLERLKQILGKAYSEALLKNLLILKPTNFKEQIDAFSLLLDITESKPISLVVVDSIAMLYRLELGLVREEMEEASEGRKKVEKKDSKEESLEEMKYLHEEHEKIRRINLMLAQQLRLLSEIARKKAIPILVTNQVYQDLDGNIKMVGGDLLKYWSKCLIRLENLGEKRKAILLKHRSLGQKVFFYRIVESGIEKARKFF